MNLRDEVLRLLEAAEAALPADVRRFGPASEAEFEGFEARQCLRIPEELRAWLLVRNGSYAGEGGFCGVRPDCDFLDIEAHYRWHPYCREREWIPVAGDGCGDTYVLDTSSRAGDTHPVCFVEHESDQTRLEYVVASGLWHFLRFILKDEETRTASVREDPDEPEGFESPAPGWPFEKEYVLARDPQIVRCASAPLPWECC